MCELKAYSAPFQTRQKKGQINLWFCIPDHKLLLKKQHSGTPSPSDLYFITPAPKKSPENCESKKDLPQKHLILPYQTYPPMWSGFQGWGAHDRAKAWRLSLCFLTSASSHLTDDSQMDAQGCQHSQEWGLNSLQKSQRASAPSPGRALLMVAEMAFTSPTCAVSTSNV